MSSKRVLVKGRVQGVFFRASTKEQAELLGLNGWVRNEPDGSVLLEVSGDSEKVRQMIEWCEAGPILARVDNLTVSEITTVHDSGFSISY